MLGHWRSIYARLQPPVSAAAAHAPVAVLDVLLVALVVCATWLVVDRRRRPRPVALLVAGITVAAAAWMTFQLTWGWHYQVPTIEARLALTPGELSAARGEAFARATVNTLNGLHAQAHAGPWPSRADMPRVLALPLSRVLPPLGVARTPWLPSPRRSMLNGYFRAAGIDGVTNPFGLEILVNSAALPVELPALVAHEYAHLAGFADEADASVVAWLACQAGPPSSRYSGALAVLPHVLGGLPRDVQRAVIAGIDAGPREDVRAIEVRLREQRPWVHAVAWQSYDRFLRANGVSEGVARYDAVARVLVGAADPVSGSLRRSPSPWPPRDARSR